MHTHITKDNRVCIAMLLRRNDTYTQIAEVLGVHRTTIAREVTRNSDPDGHYDARRAHKRARERRKESKVSYRIIDTNTNIRKLIHSQLKERLSPEQIEGRFGKVSFMTTYRYVERNPYLKKHLRRRGRRRRKYGTKRIQSRYQANKRSIHERPCIVGLGHWEGDTVVGKERKWSILTHVDKKSGYLVADLISHSSDAVHAQVRKKRYIICYHYRQRCSEGCSYSKQSPSQAS